MAGHRSTDTTSRRLEQLAGARGGAKHAAGRGDVPTLVVMLRRDCKANARLNLVAENEREQELRPADLRELGKRQQRRRHWRCRMDHGAQMRVAEIVDIGRGRVEKG